MFPVPVIHSPVLFPEQLLFPQESFQTPGIQWLESELMSSENSQSRGGADHGGLPHMDTFRPRASHQPPRAGCRVWREQNMQISWERGIRIRESKDTHEEGRELGLCRVPQRTRFGELMAREKEADKVGRSQWERTVHAAGFLWRGLKHN